MFPPHPIAVAGAPHQWLSTGSPWDSPWQFLLLQKTCMGQELEQRDVEMSCVPDAAMLPTIVPMPAAGHA